MTDPTRQTHARPPAHVLPVHILPQPNDETCGPTCLHSVYRYWGEDIALDNVIRETHSLDRDNAGRGTLAVMLGVHALSRGYHAILYTFNLQVFDPTWFGDDARAHPAYLAERLDAQARAKADHDPRFPVATEFYLRFLKAGGEIRFRDLTSGLIASCIRDQKPVLTGLSATYLYRCAREYGPSDDYDDIRGFPAGHFVVLHGYDPATRRVTVADPLADNPGFVSQRYTVPMARLVPAIMLGVLTYDANLLVIHPGESTTP
ncbi:MAG: C39 family peptidase [Phycisphaerales bacterium]